MAACESGAPADGAPRYTTTGLSNLDTAPNDGIIISVVNGHRRDILQVGDDGCTMFHWREADAPERTGQTVWSLFPQETGYFDPSQKSCMINYRVANLEQMLMQLREAGVTIEGEMAEEYGRFAWVMDPEGNKIELWEPPAPPTVQDSSEPL